MKREWAFSLVVLLLWLGLWEAASRAGLFHEFILPAPSLIADALGRLMELDRFRLSRSALFFVEPHDLSRRSGLHFAGSCSRETSHENDDCCRRAS